jgi:hypothetical protein
MIGTDCANRFPYWKSSSTSEKAANGEFVVSQEDYQKAAQGIVTENLTLLNEIKDEYLGDAIRYDTPPFDTFAPVKQGYASSTTLSREDIADRY